MGPLALALLLAPLTALHARSEGRAHFALDQTGRLDIEITLSQLDMPELCDQDLSVPGAGDDQWRALEACLTHDVPLLVRVQADKHSCPLHVARVDARNGAVAVTGVASCPTFPERLVVDWGLFAATPLDHVAIATFAQPHADPRLFMLSKRSAKLVVAVARPRWAPLLAAGTFVAVLGVAVVVVWRRVVRRRGARAAAR